MTELITAAGEADRPALQLAIAPRRFPAFQLRQRAIHTNAEHPGLGSPQNLPHLLTPVRILKEVIDDQMGAEFEMGAPAPVHPREQPAAMRVEHQPQAWAPSVVPIGLAVIDVLPGRPAVMGLTRCQPREITALQFHLTDRVEPLGHQEHHIIECHPGEGLCRVAIGALREPLLQGAAAWGLSGGMTALERSTNLHKETMHQHWSAIA